MKLMFIDFETNGLPHTSDITEVGFVITEDGKEVEQFSCLVYTTSYPPQPKEIVEITGITDDMLSSEGKSPKYALDVVAHNMAKCDYIIAHNAPYDRGIFENACTKYGVNAPNVGWIDSLRDIPYPDKYKCKKLSHLALDHGIMVDPSTLHRTIGDVKLLAQLVIQHYNIDEILAYASQPTLVVRIVIPKPWKDDSKGKNLAKSQKYQWESPSGTDLKFEKCWVKAIKKGQFEAVKQDAGEYEVVVLKEIA